MKKLLLLAVVVIGVAAAVIWRMRGPVLTLATAAVTKGEFVDVVEIRGDVRPFKSTVLSAPMMAGDLQILKIVPNGATIKTGDVVLEFDGSMLKRTIQEKQSELRQANEELRQQIAQAGAGGEADRTALLHAGYDVERAKLGLGDETITSKVEMEKGRLALADAGQRLHEAQVKDAANRTATEKGFGAQRNRITKIQADLDKAQKSLDALQIKAPADGVVSVMYNWQMSSATSQEFRAGDKAYAGANILELPDLSSVLLTARLDESDRGVLQAGQTATIHLDAIPDRDYHASVTDVSLLARVDYSTWPPIKNFDLRLTFTDADARLRPGMSAAARIAVGHLPDMLLVPTEAVFLVDGRARVYRLSADGRAADPIVVDVVKRNKIQTAVKGPLKAGDKVTLTRPDTGEKGEEVTGRRAITLVLVALAVVGLGAAGYKYRGAAVSIVSAEEPPVPTTRVVRGPLEMSVHATGSLRAVQTMLISAPPVAGGILRLVTMVETGAEVHKGDPIMEFDPTEQQYLLEQSRSELAEADQNILKMSADRDVQLAQQQVDLMAARFDVRRAELAALPDRDLVPASEYQKNQISLEEAKRKLVQMEAGSKSQTETSRAMLAVATEKRTKSKMAADRAQMAIDSLVVKAPMDGVFVPRENRDAAGNMFFGGMSLPAYQAGDNVFPGRQVADIFDISRMEVRCSVNELDRINVAAGQPAKVDADSLPGIPFTAKVKAISGTAEGGAGPLRLFAVTLQMDQGDPRLRPGTTVHLLLAGTRVENVLNLPRQAIFEKNGKSVVFARAGDTYLPIEVKPTQRGESRIALEAVGGIVEGLEVALVNPDTLRQKKSTAAPTATTGGPK